MLRHSCHGRPAPTLASPCTGPALGLVISLQSCIVLYALGYLLIIRRSFQVLQALSYKQFRIANYMVRLQVRGGGQPTPPRAWGWGLRVAAQGLFGNAGTGAVGRSHKLHAAPTAPP